MIEMLTMWFWAYVIGVFLSAVIVFGGLGLVIYSAVKKHNDEERAKETPMDRWKRG